MDRSMKFRSISEKKMVSSLTQTRDQHSIGSEKPNNLILIGDGQSTQLNEVQKTVSKISCLSPVGFDAHRLIDDSIFIQTDEVEKQ